MVRGMGMIRDFIRPPAPVGDGAPDTGKRLRRTIAQIGAPRIALTLILLIIGILVARFSWHIPLVVDAERAFYDMRATIGAPHVEQDDRITMVTYTDETLFATGIRSPLDRAILTRALAAIDQMGAQSIGIDILFDSPTAADAGLIAQLRAMRTPTFVAYASPSSNPNNIQFEQARFLRGFQARIATDRTRSASIRVTDDADSVMRRWPGRTAGSPPLLSTAMAGTADRTNLAAWEQFNGAIQFRMPSGLAVDGQSVELREVFAKLPIDTFADPEVAPFLAEEIRGRHILIGGDIIDTDEFATPLSRIPDAASGESKPMIGLEVHASMLAQIMNGALPRTIPSIMLWAAALIAVAAGALTALADVRAVASTIALLVQMVAIAVLPFVLQSQGIDTLDLPVGGPVLGWLTGFTAAAAALRAVNVEERAFAQSALGKYLPRDIAQQILRDPERLALHGEKREIFCLFSDLEGFTKMSHAISPENVARILNAYLDTLSGVVLAHGGTIDKFVGDAVVAFWGAPIAHPNDGEQAAKALIAMVAAGEAFRAQIAGWDDGTLPPIGRTRVGLHVGEAVVGNFGGEGRMQYTALGDSMNTAARLEAANKTMGTGALISAEAMASANSDQFIPMGRVGLRGRARPVVVYEPRPDLTAAQRDMVTRLVAEHDAGKDDAFVDALIAVKAALGEDPSIARLIKRLSSTEAGGHFILQ